MKSPRWMAWIGRGVVALGTLLMLPAEENVRDVPPPPPRSVALPAPVQQTVQKLFPSAEVRRAERTGKDEEARYKIALRVPPDRRPVELQVLADGQALQIEEELPEDQLPPAVVRALRKAFPNAQVKEAQRRSRIDVTYQLEVVAGGKKRELKITHRGEILEIEKKD